MPIHEVNEKYLSHVEKAVGEKSLSVVQLAGDASNRRYYRVAGKATTWVLMVWEPFKDGPDYPFLSVLNHFKKSGVNVPDVVAKFPELGIVLLEDLGDLTLERKFWEFQNQANVMPFYEQAIDELIKIHFKATADKATCTAFNIEFDVEKLLWEMNYGRTNLLEKMCNIQMSAIEQKEIEKIFLDICETLHRQPKYICHRDYHSRNLMLKLSKMRVIDFQDARMGPIQYDLVSLIKDSYVELNEESSDHLLNYYFEKRNDFGLPKINSETFDEVYEIQSIQRCFKACGSFSSFLNMRGDRRYLKYIGPTIQRVRKSLTKFPKYKAFNNILENYGVFEKNFEHP